MAGLSALRKIQIGKEATPGGTASTYTQLIGKLTAKHNYSIYRPDDHDTGLLSSYIRSQIVGEQAELSFESDFNFEQAPYILGMSVKGGVTQNAQNGLYDYSPVLNNTWTPDTYTFKYGDNQQVYESKMVFCKDLEISGSIDDAVKVKTNMYGQNLSTSTFESSVTAPSILECVKTDLGKVYIANSWANLVSATASIDSTVCDFSWALSEGASPVKYLNGQLYASAISEQKRHVECNLTLAHNSIYTSQILTAFQNQSLIFLKIAFNGSTQYKKLELLGAFKVDNPESLSDLNGQSIVKVKLLSQYDPTLTSGETAGHEWAIKLTLPISNEEEN